MLSKQDGERWKRILREGYPNRFFLSAIATASISLHPCLFPLFTARSSLELPFLPPRRVPLPTRPLPLPERSRRFPRCALSPSSPRPLFLGRSDGNASSSPFTPTEGPSSLVVPKRLALSKAFCASLRALEASSTVPNFAARALRLASSASKSVEARPIL